VFHDNSTSATITEQKGVLSCPNQMPSFLHSVAMEPPRGWIPQTRREGTGGYAPLGHSGRIALRMEQCDVFGRMPSLLGSRKLNTLAVA
jgi:hypothetical protein